MTDAKTIQLWPGGKQVTYRETDSGLYWIKVDDDWAQATPEEHRSIRIEEIARRLQEQEIYCCDSSLVDDLLKSADDLPPGMNRDEWQRDNVTNLIPDPSDWDLDECREFLDDHGIGHPITDEDADPDDVLEEWRDTARDNAEPAEVFEWWRVSKYLANRLEEAGEVVLSNSYGEWWGRCCTGQGLIMDGTLQRVASAILGDND